VIAGRVTAVVEGATGAEGRQRVGVPMVCRRPVGDYDSGRWLLVSHHHPACASRVTRGGAGRNARSGCYRDLGGCRDRDRDDGGDVGPDHRTDAARHL
jgi:hypothetical protein